MSDLHNFKWDLVLGWITFHVLPRFLVLNPVHSVFIIQIFFSFFDNNSVKLSEFLRDSANEENTCPMWGSQCEHQVGVILYSSWTKTWVWAWVGRGWGKDRVYALQGKGGGDPHQKWWGWLLGCRALSLHRWLAEEFCTPVSIYGPYSFDLFNSVYQ